MAIRILLFVIFVTVSGHSYSQLLHFNTNHNKYFSVNDASSYSEKCRDFNQEYWCGIFPKYNIKIKYYINRCAPDSIDSKGAYSEVYLEDALIYSDSLRAAEYCTTFFELLDDRYVFCTVYVNQNFNTCISIERETCFIIDINNINSIYQVDFEREKLTFMKFTSEDLMKMNKSEGLYCITELNIEKLYIELFSDLGETKKLNLKKNENPFFK